MKHLKKKSTYIFLALVILGLLPRFSIAAPRMSRKHKGSPTTDPAEEVSKNCHVELEVVWRRSLPEAPAGPPLVVDLDGDGVREIALNLLAFQTLLVSAADGRDMPGWPVVFPGSAFQTPPVLYWRDSSTPRLVVGTTAGELLQISTTGRVLPRGMRAPPLAVPRDWVGETGAPEGAEASMFLQDSVLAEGEDLERLAVEEQEREDARLLRRRCGEARRRWRRQTGAGSRGGCRPKAWRA
jgi:hypothetical protein